MLEILPPFPFIMVVLVLQNEKKTAIASLQYWEFEKKNAFAINDFDH